MPFNAYESEELNNPGRDDEWSNERILLLEETFDCDSDDDESLSSDETTASLHTPPTSPVFDRRRFWNSADGESPPVRRNLNRPVEEPSLNGDFFQRFNRQTLGIRVIDLDSTLSSNASSLSAPSTPPDSPISSRRFSWNTERSPVARRLLQANRQSIIVGGPDFIRRYRRYSTGNQESNFTRSSIDLNAAAALLNLQTLQERALEFHRQWWSERHDTISRLE